MSKNAGAAAPSETALAERLRAFLRAYRAAVPSQTTIRQAESLATFFKTVGPLLRHALLTHPARTPPVQLDGQRLKACLAALKEPMGSARSSGEFTNVWAIAGLRRNEVRNAAVLAWLLDPNGSHGLGHAILLALLARIDAQSQEGKWSKRDLSNGVTVQTEECPLGDQQDRVDISITGRDFVLFLEVKIDAPEGYMQIERYVRSAELKAKALRKEHFLVVYLSPRMPSGALPNDLVTLTWLDVVRALRTAIRRRGDAAIGTLVARQFADHIKAFA